MEFARIDHATAIFIIELQLADAILILGQSEMEENEYAAFEAMKVSLQDMLQLLRSQGLAMSILRADHENRTVFERFIREERQAEQDHYLARELAGLAPESPGSFREDDCFTHQESWLNNEEYLASYTKTIAEPDDHTTLVWDEDDDETDNIYHKVSIAGPSTKQPVKGKEKLEDVRSEHEHITHAFCSACMDLCPRFDMLELGCKRQDDINNHAYCRTCLIDLFKASLTDTTLFPPRCCGIRIPLSACVRLCPPKLIEQYKNKQVELAAHNPIYCSNRFCAQFIGPKNAAADVATCPVCKTTTCVVCKNPSHKGLCPEDSTVQLLMDVAGRNNWQRCYKCRTMVELLVGCYHMRCPCGGEFCYVCAKPWKTCMCSQWDERHLLSNRQTDHTPGSRITMPEEEEVPELDPAIDVLNDLNLRLATVAGGFPISNEEKEQVDESNLSVDGCVHEWKRVYGMRGELQGCAICHQHLKYLNNCTSCKTKVCNRCLYNRL